MKYLFSIVLASLPLGSSLFAESLWSYCRDTEKRGLFEQCQRVDVLQVVGSRARIYVHSQKKNQVVPSHQIFKLQDLDLKMKSKRGIAVMILSPQTEFVAEPLCETSGVADKDFVLISCGHEISQKVHPRNVRQLGESLASVQSQRAQIDSNTIK